MDIQTAQYIYTRYRGNISIADHKRLGHTKAQVAATFVQCDLPGRHPLFDAIDILWEA